MAFLIYTFHLQKETSRKKLWSPCLQKNILCWLCWLKWQDGKQVQHKQENLEMDEKILAFVTPRHSEFIHCLQVLWVKYDHIKNLGSNRISCHTMCQGVIPAVYRLKWADFNQNTSVHWLDKCKQCTIARSVTVVCVLCQALSCGTPKHNCDWLYPVWQSGMACNLCTETHFSSKSV
jgi:hypothetical protein